MYKCNIAENLTMLRALKGVTQEQVAKSLSVSNKTVSKWETGAAVPSIEMLAELSKYYDVTTDELLAGGLQKHTFFKRIDAFAECA